ncbi:HlyD family efflux transporter periplasmic adaptor subunit [Taibaiella lutea]|uniref:HlyD family efflux transporter periplasmic adaptor subunit n=1 Tax=Taibaiella lutea TaxID=2608001 RepID=A0A5M6CHR0_9BACT|nr:HlyD family efflux transporter periplasmic adaptor subunit [Taibaiella lutea]KAA5534526.1 HlyD family efflux transporter periplasmic adaptor subunit [Taibaiella lutea]
MFKRQTQLLLTLIICAWLTSCAGKAEEDNAAVGQVETPVTVAHISRDSMSEYIEINATSVFLLKNFVKANANGYLRSSNIRLGQHVGNGQVLFTVTTKEAQSLGNTLNKIDSSFRFNGTNSIRAGGNGYVTQLDHQTGDYVQDGEQLAVISNQNSFAFVMNAPYELHTLISRQKEVSVVLPDGESIQGKITSAMPQMDSASQTERLVIKVSADHSIPENLIAKVRLLKNGKPNAVSVPKAAVLTDETQSEFWIMKLSDDHTAVKIPVTKGMETADKVEILTPALTERERVLISGNYGLEDTARVKIIHQN